VKEKRRKPESNDRRPRPESIKKVLAEYLDTKGLAKRVHQANVIDDWAEIVGPQIAKVTEALLVTRDGTIFVAVTTNGWMTELSLMEPELVKALNSRGGGWRVRKIRFRLKG
jgi:predicted nucleic acid-binding Zn ribbon protein